jgi:hypothetical protein
MSKSPKIFAEFEGFSDLWEQYNQMPNLIAKKNLLHKLQKYISHGNLIFK